MQKFSRRLLLALSVILPLCAVALVLVYHSLSRELDEKFFEKHDSVPTRVYSRVWVLKKDAGFSTAELSGRLGERGYKQVAFADKIPSGTYAISGNQIRVALKEFSYPTVFREFLQANGPLPLDNTGFDLELDGTRIHKITLARLDGSKEESDTAIVEPVLVAQLSEDSSEARKAVPLAEIPHTLLEAIVNVEDQRFLEHAGIDPRGIARSIWANLRAGSYVQGASTITQQLTRNIYLNRSKTIGRKLKEVAMALILEMKYSKDTILEKYLNEVYFGQAGNTAIHGVSEAAKYYFGKSLSDLTIAEQALLAALIRGPYYYSPYKYYERARQRQEFVLKRMLDTSIISESAYKAALKEPLRLAPVNTIRDRAPYFTDMVKAQLIHDLPEQAVLGAGYKIFSTIDTYYQKIADAAVARHIQQLEESMRKVLAKKKNNAPTDFKLLQGALLSVDTKTNEILAMVGGRSFAESNYNRVLLMHRQVGSIFKPFVYLAALIYGKDENGQPYNAVSKLDDSPFTYEYDKQSWSPKNFEGDYSGLVTLRYALANSINVPTARLALRVGLPYVIEVARRAGIETEIAPLPSISLGTSELTPVEVARAYSTIANLGVKRELTSVLMVLDEHDEAIAHFENHEEQALPLPETANLVELMRSVFTEGTAKNAREQGFTTPPTSKTGTTNDFRDAWFAGYTPRVLTVAWVGYDKDDDDVRKLRKVFKFTGAVAALPLWTQYMREVVGPGAGDDFTYPNGTLHKVKVDLLTGGLADSGCSSGNNIVEEIFTYNNTPRFSCGHKP